MKKVAVTGGLASGKTTVCLLLEQLGAYVISSDEIIHQLYQPGSEIGKKIIQLLGPDVADAGCFNKKKIADRVFTNRDLLQELEQILHPEVKKAIEFHYQEAVKKKEFPLFVAEVPLLFESGLDVDFETTIVVVASQNVCKSRYTGTHFEARMQHQMTLDEKTKRGTLVIENNGSLSELKESVEKVYNHLIMS